MTEKKFISQDSSMDLQSPSSVIRTGALIFCGLSFVIMIVFMFRIDTRQERYLDYGKFLGKYESEQTAISKRLDGLTAELQIERAWKGTIKTDLAKLLMLETDERMKSIIRSMVESEKSK